MGAIQATHRSSVPTLDHATAQAVVDLRTALQNVRRLERADMSQASPIQKATHTQSIDRARRKVRDARTDLEAILSEDA